MTVRYNMEFSEKVKFVRMKLYLSQMELSKELGVSCATVNRWENQGKLPQLARLENSMLFVRRTEFHLMIRQNCCDFTELLKRNCDMGIFSKLFGKKAKMNRLNNLLNLSKRSILILNFSIC